MISNLFSEEFEQQAIDRIKKFAKIAAAMEFEVAVGFSGGKDSQVVYDLCKRAGIDFKAYFNHSFESPTTIKFIKENYPDVIFRRVIKDGFIANIYTNHNCLLPTSEIAYCCQDYKHNPKFVDKASVVGVRRAESIKRKKRKVFETKNKTTAKKNKDLFSSYFYDSCQGIGTKSIIQLMPIVDWTDSDVWQYIKNNNLPINSEYKKHKRIGCLVCPKASFSSNFTSLIKYPKLVDAFILAREKRKDIDWYIWADNKDYSDNKVEYICRWLNHSFRKFSKRDKYLYDNFLEHYRKLKYNL